MKKLLLAALIVGGLTGCSSDDDAGATAATNPIIGKWKLISVTGMNSTNGQVFNDTDECLTLSRVSYLENKTGNGSDFYTNMEQCAEDTYVFHWELNGSQLVTQQGGFDEETSTVNFLNNNNTMIEVSTYEYMTFTSTYTRVN